MIAAELPVKAALSDQSHGDGGERRRKERSRAPDQHLGAIHGELAGLPCEQHRAKRKDERTSDHDQALVTCLIDDAPGGRLQGDRYQAADRQRVEGCRGTPMRGNQIGREKWPEAGLHIRQEEIAGLERPEAAAAGVRRSNRKSGHKRQTSPGKPGLPPVSEFVQ